MRSLWDDGIAKAAAGLTSIEELTRVVTMWASAQGACPPSEGADAGVAARSSWGQRLRAHVQGEERALPRPDAFTERHEQRCRAGLCRPRPKGDHQACLARDPEGRRRRWARRGRGKPPAFRVPRTASRQSARTMELGPGPRGRARTSTSRRAGSSGTRASRARRPRSGLPARRCRRQGAAPGLAIGFAPTGQTSASTVTAPPSFTIPRSLTTGRPSRRSSCENSSRSLNSWDSWASCRWRSAPPGRRSRRRRSLRSASPRCRGGGRRGRRASRSFRGT